MLGEVHCVRRRAKLTAGCLACKRKKHEKRHGKHPAPYGRLLSKFPITKRWCNKIYENIGILSSVQSSRGSEMQQGMPVVGSPESHCVQEH